MLKKIALGLMFISISFGFSEAGFSAYVNLGPLPPYPVYHRHEIHRYRHNHHCINNWHHRHCNPYVNYTVYTPYVAPAPVAYYLYGHPRYIPAPLNFHWSANINIGG